MPTAHSILSISPREIPFLRCWCKVGATSSRPTGTLLCPAMRSQSPGQAEALKRSQLYVACRELSGCNGVQFGAVREAQSASSPSLKALCWTSPMHRRSAKKLRPRHERAGRSVCALCLPVFNICHHTPAYLPAYLPPLLPPSFSLSLSLTHTHRDTHIHRYTPTHPQTRTHT